jgi:hypothetical protein
MLQQHKHFIHGDQNPTTGLYFCRRCDEFAQESHFRDDLHMKERDVRVSDGIVSLRGRSANSPEAITRAEGTTNLFEPELPEGIRKRLRFTESFLPWAMKATASETIRESIRVCLTQQSQTPRYDDVLEVLDEQSQAEFESLYKRFLLA